MTSAARPAGRRVARRRDRLRDLAANRAQTHNAHRPVGVAYGRQLPPLPRLLQGGVVGKLTRRLDNAVQHVLRHLARHAREDGGRSEEHTSELQSLMRISYAVFCLKKKKTQSLNHTPKQSPQKHYQKITM